MVSRVGLPRRLLERFAQQIFPRPVDQRRNAQHQARAFGLVQRRGDDERQALHFFTGGDGDMRSEREMGQQPQGVGPTELLGIGAALPNDGVQEGTGTDDQPEVEEVLDLLVITKLSKSRPLTIPFSQDANVRDSRQAIRCQIK